VPPSAEVLLGAYCWKVRFLRLKTSKTASELTYKQRHYFIS